MKMTLSRRFSLGALGCAICAGFMAPSLPAGAAEPVTKTTLTPDQALARLMEGNRRFVADDPQRPNISSSRRRELAGGQAPFATIVGCSDSRTPAEILLGAGLGEIFVARVAGNTLPAALGGSIAYGIHALGTPIVMVLGHERCGAVTAAVDVVTKGAIVPPVMQAMLAPIIFAVNAVKGQPGDLIDNVVRENARIGARALNSDPLLADMARGGKLKVVAGYYDLDDGKIEILDL
jgi:carbonic anhydrase